MHFSKKFPYVQLLKKRRASLVLVEELEQTCNNECEKLLYKQLRSNMYYPTPHYWIEHIKANLALVPYKLALIETQPGLNEKKIIRQLKKKGWQVLFYDRAQLLENHQLYVNQVLAQASAGQTKNVSTSS